MNDTPTPTPRSDAAELTEPYEIRALGFCVVHIDDARQLERELAEAQEQRDTMAEALRMCQREMLDVLRDIQDDRQPLDGDDFHEALEKTEEALATLDQPEPRGRMIL